jgi:hypothetical protein
MYCSHVDLLYLAWLWKFPLVPSGSPTPTTTQETPNRERGNYGQEMAGNFADKWRVPRHLMGSFTCHRSATWDRWLYLPSERRHAEDFFALKNLTASARFEPTNLGTRGQHATPPKTTKAASILTCWRTLQIHFSKFFTYFHSAEASDW